MSHWSVASLNETDFNQLLEELYEELCLYDAKFSRDHFEIAVLMSRTAVQLFHRFNDALRYTQEDPYHSNTYLFAHKVVFVDDDFIISHDGSQELMRPVIGCKEIGYFPMEAVEGDYVFFNGKLKQVKYEHFIDGQRSLEVWDINVDLYGDIHHLSYEEQLYYAVRTIRKKKRQDDAWMNEVDFSAINEYLSSLSII